MFKLKTAKLIATTLLTVAISNAQEEASKPPNVLFIAVDDLNDWAISALNGNKQTIAPNLDKLASQSVLFSNAHCSAPLCGPSRASTLSGIRPSTSGTYENNHDWRENPFFDDITMLPEYFMENGYHVVGGGKIFHTNETPKGPQIQGHNDPDIWHEFFPSKDKQLAEPSRPKKTYYKNSGHFSFGPTGEGVEKMSDHKMVNWAIKELNKQHDKPLFIATGIYRPHLPWHAPFEFFDKYNVNDIELPVNRVNWRNEFSNSINKMGEARRKWDKAFRKHGRLKDAVRAYHACISYADYELGRLMKALDESEYADNTIVVLWSDHGWHLGEKNAWAKFTLWEESTRIPLLFRTPSMKTAGKICSEAVSTIDIYPTLLQLAGLKKNIQNEGKSLVPWINKPEMEKATPAITTLGKGSHSVRSGNYRYIRMSDGSEAFFDHNNDPGEWKNLSRDPEYSLLISEHRKWLPEVNAKPQKVSKAEYGSRKKGKK